MKQMKQTLITPLTITVLWYVSGFVSTLFQSKLQPIRTFTYEDSWSINRQGITLKYKQ